MGPWCHSGLDRRNALKRLGAIGLAPFVLGNALSETLHGFPAVRALVDQLVTSRNCPGVIVAIGRGEETPALAGRGTIAFDSDVAVNEDSLWRVYSMTKPVTGMAAMLLIAEGRMKAAALGVRAFEPKWCTRQDSNLWPSD